MQQHDSFDDGPLTLTLSPGGARGYFFCDDGPLTLTLCRRGTTGGVCDLGTTWSRLEDSAPSYSAPP